MEHRAILAAFGVLAAALVLAAIGSQAPAADPSGTSAKDDGSAKLEVVADVADEMRVSIVAKVPRSAPTTVSNAASELRPWHNPRNSRAAAVFGHNRPKPDGDGELFVCGCCGTGRDADTDDGSSSRRDTEVEAKTGGA